MENFESLFGNVSINLKHKASVNYAKGRCAIEAHGSEVAKSNGARAKRLSEKYKAALVDILKGKVEHSKKGLKVVFHDGSEAKY